MTGLGDVPGRLRDVVRDAAGGLRAVPYLWSPQLLLARRSVHGVEAADEPARPVLAAAVRARAALPDSPLELALAARYLGVGDPFALDRDELAAARGVVAPARPLLHLYTRRRRAALALPARRDRSRARQSPRRSATSAGPSSRACRPRGRSRPSACSASWRAPAGRSARGVSPVRCSHPPHRRGSRPHAAFSPCARPTCAALSESSPARPSAGRSPRRSRTARWRFIRRPPRVSRGGRNGSVNGCCCGADGVPARASGVAAMQGNC